MSARITVKVTLSQDNMEFLRDIIGTYKESEEPKFRRIAETACKQIQKQLDASSAKTEAPAKA